MKAEIRSMPSADYHSDLIGDTPTLSNSIAKQLLERSPLHAWTAHPRLNPDHVAANKKEYDFGTVCHSLLLEGDASVVVVDADSWRTNAAKEQRDAAYEAGLTPLLEKDWAEAQACVSAARAQLEGFNANPALLIEGAAEQVVTWDDNGVACRARLDWLRDDFLAVDDLKTTGRSANPEGWSRQIFSMGYDVQAAFYLRGVKAATGVDAEFRLIIVETDAPYALSVVSLEPAALELANAKVDAALKLWRECLESDRWPGYATHVCYAELPGWEESRWLEREARQGELAQLYPGDMGLGPRGDHYERVPDDESVPF